MVSAVGAGGLTLWIEAHIAGECFYEMATAIAICCAF